MFDAASVRTDSDAFDVESVVAVCDPHPCMESIAINVKMANEYERFRILHLSNVYAVERVVICNQSAVVDHWGGN